MFIISALSNTGE